MNYEATARSNYFRVKDDAEFRQWAQRRSLYVIPTEQGGQNYFMIQPSSDGSWPSEYLNDDTGNIEEFDLVPELARHLRDEDVAVLMEVGHEGARYVAGVALAVNARGEIRRVSLEDIYELAKGLGPQVTEAEY